VRIEKRLRASFTAGMRFWPVVLFLGVLPLAAAAAQEAVAIDRILAVVDEDPILVSEVDQVIGLGLFERQPEEPEEEFRSRVLTRLIEQRLRFHEIDRFGFSELPIGEVERQFAEFRESFGSAEEFAERLAELGLGETALKQLVAQQLMVVTYIEERLGPRVFVGMEDITAYYDEVLAAEMAAAGQPLPPIQEVREQIRDVLKQKRLNDEIERWTEELRQKADIEDYSMSGHDTPPPYLLAEE
jgi:hypothetical protein